MYTDYTEEENNEYNDYYSDDNGGNNVDKEKIKKIAFFVIVLVLLVIVIIVIAKGCSNNNRGNIASNNNNQVPAITLNRESYSIEAGEEIEIYADVIQASIDSPVIVWQTEDSNVATIEDLGNKTGLVKGINEGTTFVVAIYRENGQEYSNRCQITVTSKAIELEKIDIVQDDITIARGKDLLLQVKTTPEDAKVDNLVFTSDDPNIVKVNDDGKITGVALGTTTVSVATEDGSLSDSLVVTVTENGQTVIEATGIVLKGLSNGLKVGGTASIINDVLPSNATNKVLTWSSTNPSVATVNSEGVVTGVSAGTTTIVASASNGVSGSLEITVESDTIAVSGVTINDGASITMSVHGTKLLTYTISPDNATNKKVYFTTSDRNIVTVDSNGIIGGRNPGTAVITITTDDGKKTASITVTVVDTNSSGSTGTLTGTQTGDSSGGSSSSGSSGGSTGVYDDYYGGSQSVESSDLTNSNTCNDSTMTTITHNGSSNGAIISQYGFDNAKPFKNMSETPKIEFTEIADCVESISYKVYYGTLETSVNLLKMTGNITRVGNTISLNSGNGYYKVVLTGTQKDSSVQLTKTYYAIVGEPASSTSDTVSPYISSLVVTKSSNTIISFKASISESGSGLKLVKFCLATGDSCKPAGTLISYTSYPKGSSLTVNKTRTVTNASLYKKACILAVDANGNETATPKCANIN